MTTAHKEGTAAGAVQRSMPSPTKRSAPHPWRMLILLAAAIASACASPPPPNAPPGPTSQCVDTLAQADATGVPRTAAQRTADLDACERGAAP